MKKYIKPIVESFTIENEIMAGSLDIGEGDTREMLSKRNSAFATEDYDEEY